MTVRALDEVSSVSQTRLRDWAGYCALQAAVEAVGGAEQGTVGIGMVVVGSGAGIRLTRAAFHVGESTRVESVVCGEDGVCAALRKPDSNLQDLAGDEYAAATAAAPRFGAGGVLHRAAGGSGWEAWTGLATGGILSGSFFPLHGGHRRMKAAAEEILQCPVHYEMTVLNAEKPPLDYLSLDRRAGQFGAEGVLLTSAATFVEKGKFFPGATFVVGWDTARRIVDRRFYPGGELQSALDNIAERGCRFLVAGRLADDCVRTLSDLAIPSRHAELFVELPATLFREDVSSSEIRDAWRRGDDSAAVPGLFL